MPVVLVNQMGAAGYPIYARLGLFSADDLSPVHRITRDSLALGEDTAASKLFFPFWLRQMDSDDEKYEIFG
jgi:hypothetical protein